MSVAALAWPGLSAAMLWSLLPAVRLRPHWRGIFFMAGSPTRIAVFIDWQNAYKAAREAFGLRSLPNERGNFSPFKLARILAAGHGRGDAATLVRVEVHRGLPSSARDPWATSQPAPGGGVDQGRRLDHRAASASATLPAGARG